MPQRDQDLKFAGRAIRYPEVADKVVVVEGDLEGQEVEVVAVTGFGQVQRVVVRTPMDEIVSYWPWNLRSVVP